MAPAGWCEHGLASWTLNLAALARDDELKGWLVVHNDAVIAVLFLVLCISLISTGIPPLTNLSNPVARLW